jgi:hypothetical protein
LFRSMTRRPEEDIAPGGWRFPRQWLAFARARLGRRSPAGRERMPAIVLSCDRYHPFATHMMMRYEAVWPSHPFTFHVPYQHRVLSGARIVSRRTPGAIRATVLGLVEELDDEAWVYWCTDDRYPLRLVRPAVERVAEAVLSDRLPAVDGVLFCRWGRMWEPEHLFGEDRREGPGGVALLRRRDYSQIWLHQFLRVKVLRHLFHRFPDAVPEASVLDPLKHQVALPADHRLYVVETNLAVFGESTSRGRVTRNCAASLRGLGIGVPPGFVEIDQDITMGVIDGGEDPSPMVSAGK